MYLALLHLGNGEVGKERKKAGDGDGQLTNSRPERLVLLVEEEHERQHDEDGGDIVGGKNLVITIAKFVRRRPSHHAHRLCVESKVALNGGEDAGDVAVRHLVHRPRQPQGDKGLPT